MDGKEQRGVRKRSAADTAKVREAGSSYTADTTLVRVSTSNKAAAARLSTKTALGGALGLRSKDTRAVIAILRRGLPFTAFQRLCVLLEVTQGLLAEVTGIAARTLARRKMEGRLSFEESERLYRVAALFDRAVAVLGSDVDARRWMLAALPSLHNTAPLLHASTELGAREVEDMLGRLEHGVFS
jgi:putative toxin-antitoxin system antitoxin component (TIGR02293 family)